MSFIAFDLDGVLSPEHCHYESTCKDRSIEKNALKILDYAKQQDIPVIVNTARPHLSLNAVPDRLRVELERIYLPKPYSCDQVNSHSSSEDVVAKEKVRCMNNFASVKSLSNGYLFDDNPTNCKYARDNGYNVICVDGDTGLSEKDVDEFFLMHTQR